MTRKGCCGIVCCAEDSDSSSRHALGFPGGWNWVLIAQSSHTTFVGTTRRSAKTPMNAYALNTTPQLAAPLFNGLTYIATQCIREA